MSTRLLNLVVMKGRSMNTTMDDIRCNLCNNNNSKILFKNHDRLHNIPGSFNIVKCKNCGLIYIYPKPDDISKYYPNLYEPYNINQNDFYQSLSYTLMSSYYKDDQRKIDKLKSFFYQKIYTPLPKEFIGKILDIGCGNGMYLYNLKNQGWDVYGIDPSNHAVNFATNELGLEKVTQGFLEEIKYPDEFFDVITLNHVIEHLPDPNLTLKEIKRLLKRNGLFVITTPNFDCVSEKIFKQYWFPLETPRHLYLYTENTLRKLLEINGLQIIKTKYDISTYHLSKSLSYRLGKEKSITTLLERIKIIFLPITFVLAMLKKSDVVTIYAKKD